MNIIKPSGMTSFDMVNYIRKKTGIKKTGHSGTLDPGAAGVLPICMGKATKLLGFMTEMEKSYRAELTLGIKTETQDSYGRVLHKSEVKSSHEEIKKAVYSFKGESLQIPPMYSAVKIKGKKLYELAREGIAVEREPRKINIYEIDIVSIERNRVIFDVTCSKGTYIRTLCEDIGELLGCGGHMSFLVRRAVGPFRINDAVTVEEIDRASLEQIRENFLLPMDMVLKHLPGINLPAADEKKFINGGFVEIDGSRHNTGVFLRVYNSGGLFLGTGKTVRAGGAIAVKPHKILI